MSERRTIVYAGGFALPAGNASAQRVLENGRLLQALGYDVVLVGQLSDAPEAEIEGLRCVNIHAAPHPYYKNDAASVVAAMDAVGPERIAAVIAYNYPARPLAQLIGYARRHGFAAVVECTEWYGWEGRRLRHNLRRLVETEVRIRLLSRRAGNVICASDYGAGYFSGLNTLVLPFVIDESRPKWAVTPPPRDDRRRFVYIGSPGQGLVKDHVHLAIAAFAKLARGGADFDFQIAGLTAREVEGTFPELAADIAALGDRITFHGRLTHPQAVGLLRSADFSLFIRPDNRVSRFGFPTKLAEAFACGVPVITNPTSDIPRYLEDGANGLLLAGPDAGSVEAGLARALALSGDEMAAMKARCAARNPFAPREWSGRLADFMDKLR